MPWKEKLLQHIHSWKVFKLFFWNTSYLTWLYSTFRGVLTLYSWLKCLSFSFRIQKLFIFFKLEYGHIIAKWNGKGKLVMGLNKFYAAYVQVNKTFWCTFFFWCMNFLLCRAWTRLKMVNIRSQWRVIMFLYCWSFARYEIMGDLFCVSHLQCALTC